MAEYNREIHYVVADSYDLCVEKIKTLCGTNYQIIRKKTIKTKGILGFGKKDAVQMAYIVLPENNLTRYQQYPVSNLDFAKEKEKILTERKLPNPQMEELLSEVKALRRDFSNIQPYSQEDEHESVLKIRQLMEDNEFSQSYIKKILDKLKKELTIDDLEDFDLVQKQVVDWIGETIKIADIKLKTRPQVIVLVGPTGVGKTTTIEKIASNTIMDAKKNNEPRPSLCIITIDIMKAGALEQLKRVGEILGEEVKKAESAADVQQLYEENKNHVDYIFIDTSGYSPNDSQHIADMKRILDVKMNADVYLSVSATTKTSDLINIFRNYEPFAYDSVIITKADETNQFGNVISVLWEKHKSISYITDGQGIPRDIHKADVIDIIKRLDGFEVDRIHLEDKFGEK